MSLFLLLEKPRDVGLFSRLPLQRLINLGVNMSLTSPLSDFYSPKRGIGSFHGNRDFRFSFC